MTDLPPPPSSFAHQRDSRSRSPSPTARRRSRSPTRDRRPGRNRSYSPRSRSRSPARDDYRRRSRSPLQHAQPPYAAQAHGYGQQGALAGAAAPGAAAANAADPAAQGYAAPHHHASAAPARYGGSHYHSSASPYGGGGRHHHAGRFGRDDRFGPGSHHSHHGAPPPPPPPGGSFGYAGAGVSAGKEAMMQSVREASQQERRVYVGNLAYDVKWHHLKDFMRQAGDVLFADVLLLPNGMSKGCGIVEYATREQAQNAVATLSNQNLMGRLVYVREDREAEPRFTGASPRGDFGGRGGYGGGPGAGYGGAPSTAGRQLYVSNLPYTVGWQDLKDLFRQAAQQGNIIRADVHTDISGRPKGSGIVVFESPDDARNAIAQFNGYEWNGRPLDVHEDRFPIAGAGPPRGGFGGRGGFPPRGGFGARGGGFGMRGGFGGGRGGYAGYASPGGAPAAGAAEAPLAPNPFTDYATSGGEPSATIYVRNLPWSTCNEDLVDLFQTIGKVERAEIQYEPNGRSRGTGIVLFDCVQNAETAITKFTGYQYGGRPLGLSYVKYITPGVAPAAGSVPPPPGAPVGVGAGIPGQGAGAPYGDVTMEEVGSVPPPPAEGTW